MSHYEMGSAPDQTTTAIKWPHDSLAAHLAVGVGSAAARYSDSGSPGGFAPLAHNHSGSAAAMAATLRIPSLAASYSNNNSTSGGVYNRFVPAPQPQPQPGLVTAPSTQQQHSQRQQSDAAQKLFAQLTNSANATTTQQQLSQFVNQQHHLYMAAAAEEAKLLDSSQKLIQDWRDRTSKLAVTATATATAQPISTATLTASADQLWLEEQKTNLVHQLAQHQQPYQKQQQHLIQQRLSATTPPNITTSPSFISQPQPSPHSPILSQHSSTPNLLTPSASKQQQVATIQQHQSAAALVTAATSSPHERNGTASSLSAILSLTPSSNTPLEHLLVKTSHIPSINTPDSTTTSISPLSQALIDGGKVGGAFTSFKHTSSSVIMPSHSNKDVDSGVKREDIMEMNDQMNGIEHHAQVEVARMKEVDSEYAEVICGGSSSVGSSTKSDNNDMDILDQESPHEQAASSNSSSSSNTIKDESNQNGITDDNHQPEVDQKGGKNLLLHILSESSNQQQLPIMRSILDYDTDENNGNDITRTTTAQELSKGEEVMDELMDEVKPYLSNDTAHVINNGTAKPKEDSNSPSSLLLNLSQQQQQRESVKTLSSSPIKTEVDDSDINNNNNDESIGVDKQHHDQIVTTSEECDRLEEEPLLTDKLPTSCSVATPNSCTNSTSSVISTTSNSPPRSTLHSQPPLSLSPVSAEITTSTPSTGSFCRAPGLGPLPIPEQNHLLNSSTSSSSSSQLPLVCALCGFSCNSKFHYNSHMNTHGDHQCTMCDYTSRTEGRLKKHMRDSHTIQDQMAAGLDVEIASSSALFTPVTSTSQLFSNSSTNLASSNQLGTTMTSVLEAANLAAATQLAAAMHAASSSNSTSPNHTSTPPSSTSDDHQIANTSSASNNILLPSALDQIRAFTENPSILPDLSSSNLASALMSHGLLGTAPPISEASTSFLTEEQQASTSCSLTTNGSSSERRSSGSKPKTYKCKQCSHVSASKEEQWVHARTHIPVEKQLGCTRCGFVTEYKHHLEYHLRNHMGSKPFHCKKCAYSCVNKSMLNSHMKSHTNVYQFRCRDCTYATKYCHSLKLHLKKYNHTRAGDANDSSIINGHHNAVSPFESTNESDSLRRLSESYSMNGADEDTSPTPTSAVPTAQQSLANSTAMNLNPMVTSSSLTLASQLLLRQHQLEQMDVVMRMNGLSGAITPSAMLPNVSSTTTNSPAAVSRCALCNYQAVNEEDNLRHQMTHLIAHQSDPAATAASLYNSIASMQNCHNQSLTTTSPRVVNECDGRRELSTSDEFDEKLNDEDTEQMLDHDDRCFNNISGDTHQTSPIESAKSSGDEGSLTADEMCAEKGGGASKRKAGLKLNQIAARLHVKNSPGVEDMHFVDSTDCVTNERMDDDEKELSSESPLAATLPISAPIASRPTPTRVLPAPLTLATDTTNLNFFQQACIAHMQNMEQKLRSAFDMWRFSCPHCKMAFQDEPLFHIHMGYHGYENPFKCNRCGQACNDGLTFNLHLLQAKH